MIVTVDPGAATVAVRLLELLSELPSTPALVAAEARERGAVIQRELPVPAPGQHAVPAIELEDTQLTAIAGLLDLLSGMPSTPPDIAADATAQASRLWTLLSGEADAGNSPRSRERN